MSDSKKSLYAALLEAQRAAKSVEKASKNEYAKYKYAKAEDIIDEAKSALNAAGLVCFCTGWKRADTVNASGVVHEKLLINYILAHPETGDVAAYDVEQSVVEGTQRPADKAEATALTYNLGYFLRGLLMLPRVEEGTDVDQRDDSKNAPRKMAAPSAPKVQLPEVALETVIEAIEALSADNVAQQSKVVADMAKLLSEKDKAEARKRFNAKIDAITSAR